MYGYNNQLVYIWAPDMRLYGYNWIYGNGRMIYVGRGWAGGLNSQDSLSCDVRVMAWLQVQSTC